MISISKLKDLGNTFLRGQNLSMYKDMDGFAKYLPDNTAGTLLYARGSEIVGEVIIAVNYHRYNTYPFHFQEDLYEAFAEISITYIRQIRKLDQLIFI